MPCSAKGRPGNVSATKALVLRQAVNVAKFNVLRGVYRTRYSRQKWKEVQVARKSLYETKVMFNTYDVTPIPLGTSITFV